MLAEEPIVLLFINVSEMGGLRTIAFRITEKYARRRTSNGSACILWCVLHRVIKKCPVINGKNWPFTRRRASHESWIPYVPLFSFH